MCLTDLTFIDDGNADFIPGTKLINFSKLGLLANVIRDLQQYQKTPYSLEKVPFIQEYLLSRSTIFNEDVLYNKSLEREPRVSRPKRSITSN